MLYKHLIIEEGDEIWAYRPIYNGTEEICPLDKQIRPYIVLKLYDNRVLAAPITSNTSHQYNYPLRYGSDVAVNDLYIIKDCNIIRHVRSFNKAVIDDIYRCYYKSIEGNHMVFPDEVKQAFLDAYNDRFEQNTTHKEISYYDVGDIVFLEKYPERKYIIDEVCDDKYYGYHIISEEINDALGCEIDFSSRIMLEKEDYYSFLIHLSKAKYFKRKKQSLSIIREEHLNRKKRKSNINAYTGSIVEFNKREYFIIFITTENRYYCIPYNSNYQLDKIRVFNKGDVKYVKQLSNEEALNILEMVRSNLSILGNEKVQNKIYMKILELK